MCTMSVGVRERLVEGQRVEAKVWRGNPVSTRCGSAYIGDESEDCLGGEEVRNAAF